MLPGRWGFFASFLQYPTRQTGRFALPAKCSCHVTPISNCSSQSDTVAFHLCSSTSGTLKTTTKAKNIFHKNRILGTKIITNGSLTAI